ncbi:response regulator [Erythrobacter sp. W53]|uniref:response regulator n=1 Tax=Erythrobacter sp. W53 TaxID=3425947 RepID=UPI003D767842
MMQRILVIDDDAILAGLLQLTLEMAGYEVETAADGDAGLSRVKTGAFDLVLLDLVMPKIDGIKFLRLLHEGAGPRPPVMIVSSATDGVMSDEYRALGVIDVARKPVEPDELLGRVDRALKQQPARVGGASA